MNKKRILVIEDEYDISFIISTCLEEFGTWETLTTQSPHEGITLAQTEKPDAIILDVMMPDMDGLTLFNYLKSEPNTQEIPVILMTAKVQNSDLKLFHNLGVKGVISKPFDPLKLVEQITELLQWK
ncbi:response regulator [Anabaena sp. PCC 7108]|uniref:response regulator n=1 Tax=Anabaena sp. PCC 7108 TaxID=163908 RepID=UPI00034D7482|nr:response regulator [Anabaena sp. PCC 7108]